MAQIPLLRNTNKKRVWNKRDDNSDANRARRQKVYQSNRYRKLRDLKRHTNPTCEICLLLGKYRAVEDVHHWLTFCVEDPYVEELRAYDFNNLVSLCRHHHNSLHTDMLKGCYSLKEVQERIKYLTETQGIKPEEI